MNIVADLSEELVKKDECGRQSPAMISSYTVPAPHLFKRGVFRAVSGSPSFAMSFLSVVTVAGILIAVWSICLIDKEAYWLSPQYPADTIASVTLPPLNFSSSNILRLKRTSEKVKRRWRFGYCLMCCIRASCLYRSSEWPDWTQVPLHLKQSSLGRFASDFYWLHTCSDHLIAHTRCLHFVAFSSNPPRPCPQMEGAAGLGRAEGALVEERWPCRICNKIKTLLVHVWRRFDQRICSQNEELRILLRLGYWRMECMRKDGHQRSEPRSYDPWAKQLD